MRQKTQFAITALALAIPQLSGCHVTNTYIKVEPAVVEHQEGQEISKLTLTQDAMKRLDIQTVSVQPGKAVGAENEPDRTVVPYSAIIYVPTGEAFVYTSPEPRVFMRQLVEVDYIDGDVAVLKSGPAPETQVASVGVAELLGTEIGVGH